MVDFLIGKMEAESIAAKLKKHLNLGDDAYDEFLESFATKAKTEPHIFFVNDYSGI